MYNLKICNWNSFSHQVHYLLNQMHNRASNWLSPPVLAEKRKEISSSKTSCCVEISSVCTFNQTPPWRNPEIKNKQNKQHQNFLMTETCISSNRTIKLKPNSNEEKQKNPPKRTRKWGDFHQKKRSTIHNWLRA